MKFEPTPLDGVVRIIPRAFEDDRGYFMESWNERVFEAGGISASFVQDNLSYSTRGTLRGLHYQVQSTQAKLVRVVLGEVFDVAVDVRQSSDSFGQWYGEVLSAENRHQLWIPEGFAHGFLVLSDTAIFEYKCSDYYAPEHERTIIWDDPSIGIDWPFDSEPTLSTKDAAGVLLHDAELFP